MTEVRVVGEMRTDLDQEATNLQAERWAEAVFAIGDEELVLEISIEENVMVAIMVGDEAQWKGTLAGLKKFLRGEIPAK
ncbi:MAG: hypothetical protein ABIJ61_12730 [bacterium]